MGGLLTITGKEEKKKTGLDEEKYDGVRQCVHE